MATSIVFTDGTGTATLTNGKPGGWARFGLWTHHPDSVGPRAPTLGGGLTYHWSHRVDYLASFELAAIPRTSLDVVSRLILHLEGGGSCTVNTGDSASRIYTCYLAPGVRLSPPELTDRTMLEYTLRLTLKNGAAAPLLCTY